MKKYICLFGLAIILTSCGKNGLFSIFDDSENLVDKTINLGNFNYLKLESVFEVYLTQDTSNSLTIEGDESIIAKVSANLNDSVLEISNSYKAKWLKPKSNKVKLYLKFKVLKRIDIIETCNVQSENAITGEGLGVIFEDKLSEANLNLNCKSFYYWNNHPCGGKLTLSGNTEKLVIWNFALMSVDASNLTATEVSIENHAQGNCWVRPVNSLTFSIFGTGNIYYYGNPARIDTGEITSSGRLYKISEK
jgi:hypothetical protein